MRPLLWVVAWIAVSISAISLGAVFGGEERLSRAEYFAQLESLMTELRAGEDELAQQHPAPANDAPLDVMVANLMGIYEAYVGLRRPFAERLAKLRPPLEIRATHRALLKNAKEIAEGQSEAVRLLGDVRVLVDVQAAFRHLYGPTQLFTVACKELQAEADALSADVGLRCPR